MSWWAGIYMATHQGMQYGTEIVFTYGPLGFMKQPWLWYGGMASLAFVYVMLLYVAVAWALVANLRPRTGAPAACLITVLVISQVPGIDYSITIALLGAMALIARRPSGLPFTVFMVGGAVFAAAESLMKLSSGPVILLVVLAGLIGARASLRQIGIFAVTYVVSGLAFWLLAGQNLANLPDFMVNSVQIVVGYTEAMSTYGGNLWWVPIMIAAVGAILVWTWFGEFPDRRARLAAMAIALVVAGAMYKQGVVRMDGAHRAIFLAMMAMLWVAIPTRRAMVPGVLIGLAILSAASIYAYGTIGARGVNVVANVELAVNQAKTLLGPDRKQALIDSQRSSLQFAYLLGPEQKKLLDGRTVSIEPTEVAAAWVYELDWQPVPVFQGYSAYTSKLDEINAEAIASPSGPERILRGASADPTLPNAGLDGRYLGWDPPGQVMATLCNFRPISTTDQWQVLARVEDRCGDPVPAGEVDGNFDEPVEVPVPKKNQVIFARIEGAEVKGLEKLRSLIYRPRARVAITSSGLRYRFLGALAGDGLLLRAGKGVGQSSGPFAQIPQTSTIELTGSSGSLRFDFFRMRVDPGRAGRAKKRSGKEAGAVALSSMSRLPTPGERG